MTTPTARDLAELVRLPAVLSVPGDALLGSAAGHARGGGRLAVSSALLYLSGMALNDYADRAVDMLERPTRPIPSGRIPADLARRLALYGTLGGIVTARVLGGRRAFRTALAVAGSVWSYDLKFKGTRSGPAVMAACRGLDVLLGASRGSLIAAAPAALVVAAHTATLTVVSEHEFHGGEPKIAATAATRTSWVAGAGGCLTLVRLARRWSAGTSTRPAAISAAISAGLLAHYAFTVRSGFTDAALDPSPQRMQRSVGKAVLGSASLQAGLLAGAGAVPQALAVAVMRPIATAFARRKGVS